MIFFSGCFYSFLAVTVGFTDTLKISQKCSENNTIQWFDAKVISIKTIKADAIKTEYNIRYDDCPDDIWFFPLLMDLKKGDLLVTD